MKSLNYDVVVIGGGPAGSTVAYKLATNGHRVLVLEKEKFPREHVGESLLPFTYQIFEEIGVMSEMKKRFTRKPGVTFSNVDGSVASNWCFNAVIKDDSFLSFHVHRAAFDQMLLENSAKNGVEVMEETKVTFVKFNDDHVEIQAMTNGGMEKNFTAQFVVDASGQSTFLGQQMKNKRPFASMAKRVAYSAHWANAKLDEAVATGNIKILHLEGKKLGWLWMIPIYDNRLSIGVSVNLDYAKERRRALSKESKDWVKDFYLEEIMSSPAAAETIRDASIISDSIAANSDFSYYVEDKYNAQYALVGDASAFLDPIFSSGVYLGMKSALLVGEGIHDWLTQKDDSTMKKAYEETAGAYKLVEKLINTFYEPGSIKWAGADRAFDQSYEKFELAYSILHLILAGDFFTNSAKYIKAIELLRDPKMIKKYRNLIKHPETNIKENKLCATTRSEAKA